MIPLDRLPIALNADGVRSRIRLVAQLPLQQDCSPHQKLVCGPQSAIVTAISVVRQRFRTKKVCPQVRRSRLSPHWSGRVMLKQASEALGQAHWRLPELQVPQAPWLVAPQGPQALPQQNQDASPV